MELHGTKLFIVASTISQVIDEMEKQNENNTDEDTKIAMEYLLQRFYDIKRDVDGAILEELTEGMARMRKVFEESNGD